MPLRAATRTTWSAPVAATEGRSGGLISFTVGSSTSGAGSSIDAIAVLSEVNMVGTLSLGFGEGTATTGTTGASGVLGFSSGSAPSSNSGAMWLGTGAAMEGRSGLISFTVPVVPVVAVPSEAQK